MGKEDGVLPGHPAVACQTIHYWTGAIPPPIFGNMFDSPGVHMCRYGRLEGVGLRGLALRPFRIGRVDVVAMVCSRYDGWV